MLINLVLREIRNHKYAFHIETLLIVRHVFSTLKSFNLRRQARQFILSL